MKVFGINAGSRDEGLTATLLNAAFEAAREAGAETASVSLKELDIERCRMCDEKGWGLCRAEGRCVIEDDLERVVEGMRQADSIVFATPKPSSGNIAW